MALARVCLSVSVSVCGAGLDQLILPRSDQRGWPGDGRQCVSDGEASSVPKTGIIWNYTITATTPVFRDNLGKPVLER